MDSSFAEACERMYNTVQTFLKNSSPPSVSSRACKNAYPYKSGLRSAVQTQVATSLARLKKSISHHGLNLLAVSYNGGKDCLVMLVLVLAAIHELTLDKTIDVPTNYKLDSIFIHSEEMFPELLEFIASSTKQFGVNFVLIKLSLKEGLEQYLTQINPAVLCIVIGVRYSDPYSANLSVEQETDSDWPQFTRIHPILDWSYVNIWDFIIGCDLEYCSLYDKGYSSLGGIDSTVPNEYLRIDGASVYYPAYMLQEDADTRERAGRKKPSGINTSRQ